ncbi:hypothetical protein [Spiroplasma turonicum]|uniref:Uncharacterized protein n=1 Tax=Spiroplasma turonicum TaxID=216946 RepID=A0A0K1P627_9MOLU|nr:hypothetical protein [Spiroplasma turonicum]AKU79720.1 hypothetical protein STURON_00474 [Spiroplasma turonicum]ALX70738.1 hypothetical protein STURO_v1c04720 [Spiroplasma turonicum]
MSYYYKHKYGLSTHAMQRIKQRLSIKENDEFLIRDIIANMIDNSNYSFQTSKTLYIKSPKNDIYFIIDILSNTIITATKISAQKQLDLINADK